MFEDILKKNGSKEDGYITMRFHKSVILDMLTAHGKTGLDSMIGIACEMLKNEIEHYAETITTEDSIKRLQEIIIQSERRKENNV